MKQRLLVSGFAIAGLLCLGLGLMWNRLTSSENYWTQQQSEEYNAAQSDLHKKSRYVQNESETQRQEFEAAKSRLDRIAGELERARNTQSYTGVALQIIGAAAILIAAYFQYQSKPSE